MTRAPAAAALLALAFAAPAAAQLFGKEQAAYMFADPSADDKVKDCDAGSAVRLQYMYHMFSAQGPIQTCDEKKPRGEWCSCKPPWLEAALPAMLQKQAWVDPTEGKLNEAGIWQGPISVLYEFFTIVQKCVAPELGGAGVPPAQLMREFADNRTRFNMSLDRLYRARQGSSLEGRGAALMAHFGLVSREYDSVMDALIREDRAQFVTSVMGIAKLSHMAFKELRYNPRGGKPPKAPPSGAAMGLLLTALSTFLIFVAVYQMGVLNSEQIAKSTEDYWRKSQGWAQEFNRQFLTIKVHYLVLGPVVLFTLLGIMTFSIPVILLSMGVGLAVGLALPPWLIEQIRFFRGRQVERQLIDALTLLANALKSGLDLVGGFRLVQKELLPPISEEFGLVIKNFDLGMPFARALEGLEDRIDSRLLSYMIKAVVIQQQVGGNIIKIFDRIVENIREEAKLTEKTSALTAQQRIQSYVVSAMPAVMMGVMFVFQPKQMGEFYSRPLGVIVLLSCVVWIGVGMKVISGLGKIRV